jgi:multisite-specific tRNA:(cytosine-C5)-methyltransferase
MATPKSIIRRFAPFASFQKFLVAETEVGNISRQEVVSMIPPLLMDLRPGMAVLDMCAAPGSKSAQLMEMIHIGEEESMKLVAEDVKNGQQHCPEVDLEDDGRSTGLLIANDNDYKRAHMLIHQMKRLNSPNLIVTNHDATMYPSIKLPSLQEPSGKPSKHRYLKFDRILADVPCSGDGTARKNSNIWTDWVPGNALGLHVTQARILVRALQMLKVGGRVVYSTCSMNPIENEAVVASAIDRCGGPSNVEIIDCSAELPGLKRAPGLGSWKVMDKHGRMWSGWLEVERHRQREGVSGLSGLAEGMFPPVDENASLPLERCMRIYPHLQDSGGFFIAVLRKTSEIKAKPEDSRKVIPKAAVEEGLSNKKYNGTGELLERTDAQDEMVPDNTLEVEKNATVAESSYQSPYFAILDSVPSPEKRGSDHLEDELPTKRTKFNDSREAIMDDLPRSVDREMHATESQPEAIPQQFVKGAPVLRKRKPGQPFEEPFKYLDRNLEELKQIFAFYNISDRFPRDRFMVRNAQGHPSKTIYYSSVLARDILTENEGRGIKFVHCGVKMFVKQDAQRPNVCRWRIQTDGLQILKSWVGPERCINLYKKETLHKLLVEMFPRLDGDSWKELEEIGERAWDMAMGCCVLRIEPSDAEDGLKYAAPDKCLSQIKTLVASNGRSVMRIINVIDPTENEWSSRSGALYTPSTSCCPRKSAAPCSCASSTTTPNWSTRPESASASPACQTRHPKRQRPWPLMILITRTLKKRVPAQICGRRHCLHSPRPKLKPSNRRILPRASRSNTRWVSGNLFPEQEAKIVPTTRHPLGHTAPIYPDPGLS